ncbi:MAG: YhcH/YjgK/YiaL family protein [Deltaproteobacteria bacterium]|nr:YhcH/YjgK/YiaL family protein [Deltaproteobacteria bacterium]
MLIDQLKNASLYYGLGAGIARALRFLEETDVTRLPAGRHELEGDEVYAIVQDYETKRPEQGAWEAHRKYIDVQYVARGSEQMGFSHLGQLAAGPYDAEKDFLRLEGPGEFLHLREGTFMILWPEDAHMPGMAVSAPEPVRKVVVKVRVPAGA